MSQSFFESPILNSPYGFPGQHWELVDGQPTNQIISNRRRSDFYSPVPKPKKRRQNKGQANLTFEDVQGLTSDDQEYSPTPIINEIRGYVEKWRSLPNPNDWGVTPDTARLLQHWRHYDFKGVRPFFCQVEAVETAIWLAEVAPKMGAAAQKFAQHLKQVNAQANPELMRTALKLATGAGKTTVMAMLIAWQTINAKRHPNSKQFSRGFLIVAPGLTIRDRLRVLLPNDLDSYYKSREIVPPDMLADLAHAKIVITNYHSFRLRERLEVAKGTRQAIEGWRGDKLQTLETEGQMIQRVMPELMGMKNIVVLNDEAHHCYRAREKDPDGGNPDDLAGEEKDEAKENNEAARMWISGLESVKRKLGVSMVYDLSATPFFLSGSGYREGTLFPWTMSDFSLMDAIECGIVKLPRVPVADNVLGGDTPMYRNLWDHIGQAMPKKGRGKGSSNDPNALPNILFSAIEALYGHYKKTFELWQDARIGVPPVFIVVCNNVHTSELVYQYMSGYVETREDGTEKNHPGHLELFNNYDSYLNRLPRPNTILIDSKQLESGDILDKDFRKIAAVEIEQFKREIIERTGNTEAADKLSDAELLREVMNTVGRKGRLGEQIRCVVSVSMLTEGWDANTVTHILGLRKFGTQLLCEQVVGRGLRRQSYELNPATGLFDVEYADIFGIPFDFAANPVISLPTKPRETVRVFAVKPERDVLEISFPRVEGYRIDLPEERLDVQFTEDSILYLTPEKVGATETTSKGLIGEGVDMNLQHLGDMRQSTILFHLARHLVTTKYRDAGEDPKYPLFNHLKSIARQWLDGGYLKCSGGTYPAQLAYRAIADDAANRIAAAITISQIGEKPVKALIDAYNPKGSSSLVNFTTSKETRYETDGPPPKCHVNWVVCDSDWEAEFCRVVEAHPKVFSYVKNQGLGLEVPYLMGSVPRKYLPDFILHIDDGQEDPLNLIVEIKGYRGEDAKEKANTMRAYWVPGVNNLKRFGRWDFAELRDGYAIESDFAHLMDKICSAHTTSA